MSRNERSNVGKSKRASAQPTKYHHGDLRNSLLDFSVKLLRKNGPQAFSLRELASNLGVSSAAPYRHFKSKERIFSAIAVRGFELLTIGFKEAISGNPKSPRDQLDAVGVKYYEFAVKHPEFLQMMFGGVIPPREIAKDAEFGTAAGKAFGALLDVVGNCQAVGALDPKENSRQLAILIWSSIHGFAALDSAGTLRGASGLGYDSKALVIRISKAISTGLKICK